MTKLNLRAETTVININHQQTRGTTDKTDDTEIILYDRQIFITGVYPAPLNRYLETISLLSAGHVVPQQFNYFQILVLLFLGDDKFTDNDSSAQYSFGII